MLPRTATAAPCDDNGTSYAWIAPDGTVHKLNRGSTHEGFAWRMELDRQKANPKPNWKEDEVSGQDLMYEMLKQGWIQVTNSFVFGLNERRVTPKALTALIEMMTDCILKSHRDPEEEDLVWIWDLANRVEKTTVAKFIHKHGTKAQEDALFAQLMKVAKSAPCDANSTSYAWIDPTGRIIVLGNKTHVHWAWQRKYPDGKWNEDDDFLEGVDLADTLKEEGWIRVVNSLALDFSYRYVTDQAMTAAIGLLVDCVIKGGKDIEAKILIVTNGADTFRERQSVTEFIHKYGTKAQEEALFNRLMKTAKTPCESESTSYAWIDPSGKVIQLPRKQSHVEWAWRKEHGSGWDEEFDWDEGMEASDNLLHEGWVRVPNSFTLEFDAPHVSPRAMAAAIDGLITCTVQSHKDPEKEIVWATPGEGVLKIPVSDFIHQYGTRAQENALFEQLLASRVARSYLASRDGCNPQTVSYAWIDPTGEKHLCTFDHMMFAVKYLTDQGLTIEGEPPKKRPYKAMKTLVGMGWLKVSNYMVIWGSTLGKPAPAWEALAEMVAGCATPFTLDRNMEIWVGYDGDDGAEKKEIEVADFIKRFGGRRLLDQVYERLDSTRGIDRSFPRDVLIDTTRLS